MYHCETCNKRFSRGTALASHKKSHAKSKPKCEICSLEFNTPSKLERHLNSKGHERKAPPMHYCYDCARRFNSREALHDHLLSKGHNAKAKAFEDVIHQISLKDLKSRTSEITEFIGENSNSIKTILNGQALIKFKVIVSAVFQHQTDEAHITMPITTPFFIKLSPVTKKLMKEIKSNLSKELDKVGERLAGSNWSLLEFRKIKVVTCKINAFNGKSFVPMPFKSNAYINPQNEDNQCFKWAVLAALHSDGLRNPSRVSHYESFENDYIWEGIEFPTPIDQIPLFERNNKISINVYQLERKDNTVGDKREDFKLIPLQISEFTFFEKRVHLLLLENHYVCIKNLRGAVRFDSSNNSDAEVCSRCLYITTTKEAAEKHYKLCVLQEPAAIEMPRQTLLRFEKFNYQLSVPFVVYADIECVNIQNPESIQEMKTKYLAKQVPCCIYLRCKSLYPDLLNDFEEMFQGKDCMKQFVKWLDNQSAKFRELLKTEKPYNLSLSEREAHQNSEACIYCGLGDFTADEKVVDHDHFNGAYRGAAHSKCNLQARKPKHIPIYFHNLSKYDLHLIVTELKTKALKPIPLNEETYISLDYGCYRFTDSLRMLQKSLDGVAKSLGEQDFDALKKVFDTRWMMMKEKGIYPYEYITSFETLNETSLPPIECFYSKLSNREISNEEYERAQRVWTEFNCQTLWDYTLLYLKQDVCLLEDCMEKFRKIFKPNPFNPKGLDPAHFVSTPGLTWENGLYQTGVELELLQDPDMYLMLEKGIRGGISSVMGARYRRAFNKLSQPNCDRYRILDDYDFKRVMKVINENEGDLRGKDILSEMLKTNYLLYVDANNLYGYAMSQYMPCKDFEWIAPSEELIEQILSTPKDSDIGYILEADLEYEDRETTQKFPLAPEPYVAKVEDLSPYQLNLLPKDKDGNPKLLKVPKLVCNLKDKKEYVVHYSNLQFYLSKGLKLTNVHKILRFKQRPWLKEYIDMNTQMRTAATTDFEKDIWKLMNNAFFGKTMENVRKRQEVELVNSSERAKRLMTKPTFKKTTIFTEKLAAIHMHKTTVKLCKPIYLGFCILELSKLLMYETFYNVFLPKWGDNLEFLYMDTDSMVLNVRTEDVYEDLRALSFYMDFSEYPVDHPLYDITNKKVVGKFKDELGGKVMEEWCAFRSKCYAFSISNAGTKEKLKGVKSYAVPKFEEFKQCLFDNTLNHVEASFTLLRSKKHQINVVEVTKTALTKFDDKRFIHADGIETSPLH